MLTFSVQPYNVHNENNDDCNKYTNDRNQYGAVAGTSSANLNCNLIRKDTMLVNFRLTNHDLYIHFLLTKQFVLVVYCSQSKPFILFFPQGAQAHEQITRWQDKSNGIDLDG